MVEHWEKKFRDKKKSRDPKFAIFFHWVPLEEIIWWMLGDYFISEMIAKNKLYFKKVPPYFTPTTLKILSFLLKNLKIERDFYFIYSAPPKFVFK